MSSLLMMHLFKCTNEVGAFAWFNSILRMKIFVFTNISVVGLLVDINNIKISINSKLFKNLKILKIFNKNTKINKNIHRGYPDKYSE